MKNLSFIFCFGLLTSLFLNAQTNAFPTSGNVGIGTITPIEKLDVREGNINIFGYNSSRYIRFTETNLQGAFINYDGTSNILKIGVNNINSTNTNNDNSIINIVRSTGYIGINTTSPNSKLGIYYGSGTSTIPGVRIFGGGAIYDNIALSLDDTGTSPNNVNILEFKNASFRSAIIKSINPSSNNSTGGNLVLETTSSYNGTLNADQLVLKNNGNIGIGTYSPDAKLAVKGNIHTNEVKVDLLGAVAPDYVFYKDYDLKTLTEVENYIAKEGHLPNIPSAKEMETNGIYLKEMNLKLLEKIEELTLYTIQQEKEIKASKDETTALKKEVENQKIINKNLEESFNAQETRLQKIEALLNSIKQ